jgi:hypothetical protein
MPGAPCWLVNTRRESPLSAPLTFLIDSTAKIALLNAGQSFPPPFQNETIRESALENAANFFLQSHPGSIKILALDFPDVPQ